jgi:hypothetical protein
MGFALAVTRQRPTVSKLSQRETDLLFGTAQGARA